MNQHKYRHWIINSFIPALRMSGNHEWRLMTTSEIRQICSQADHDVRSGHTHPWKVALVDSLREYEVLCRTHDSYSAQCGWKLYSFTDRIRRAMDTAVKLGLVANIYKTNSHGIRTHNAYRLHRLAHPVEYMVSLPGMRLKQVIK